MPSYIALCIDKKIIASVEKESAGQPVSIYLKNNLNELLEKYQDQIKPIIIEANSRQAVEYLMKLKCPDMHIVHIREE